MDPQDLARTAQKHGIRLLLQFGSSVTGLVHPDSDVDFAVRLERVPDTLEQEADLIADLQALTPGRNIDVTLINRADPLLLKQIAAHARLVYGTPREFDAFKLYAFKRYQDHCRYFDLEREYVDRALERMTR